MCAGTVSLRARFHFSCRSSDRPPAPLHRGYFARPHRVRLSGMPILSAAAADPTARPDSASNILRRGFSRKEHRLSPHALFLSVFCLRRASNEAKSDMKS